MKKETICNALLFVALFGFLIGAVALNVYALLTIISTDHILFVALNLFTIVVASIMIGGFAQAIHDHKNEVDKWEYTETSDWEISE